MQNVCDGIYPGQSTFLSYPWQIWTQPTWAAYFYTHLWHYAMEPHQFSSLTSPVVESHGGRWQWATWLCPTVHRPACWGISHRNELSCLHGTTGGRTGLQQLLEVVFAQNSATHMLTGKAIARAVRGHFLADAVLNAELYRARVATKCKTYRSVQTDYASVWCKNSGMLIISRILRLVLRQIMV